MSAAVMLINKNDKTGMYGRSFESAVADWQEFWSCVLDGMHKEIYAAVPTVQLER